MLYRLDGHEHSKDEAELLSKISNSVINTIGVIACLVGIERIQQLDHKHKSPSDEEGFDLDETLLRWINLKYIGANRTLSLTPFGWTQATSTPTNQI